MFAARVDLARDPQGGPVVLATFDLSEAEIAAAAAAVSASVSERFRSTAMSADDVLELRELTSLGDELAQRAAHGGAATLVMSPARLSALDDALAAFIEAREEAEWLRDEEREALAAAYGLVGPLEELRAEAMRAALSPPREG